ncbi:MAG: hypothetical protein FJ160_02810 [Gammaproteobacteria bacterium]|nr:hypothetical protein [Gammaproteobacteria bacterium]
MQFTLVVATRATQEAFLTDTALGRCLQKQQPHGVELRLFAENTAGLPEIYNSVIEEHIGQSRIMVFLHDDIHLLDFYWTHRLQAGLQAFDVVGLAGNVRRVPRQPGWAFVRDADGKRRWDDPENLSGVVAHGKHFPPNIWSVFGSPRKKVLLLDGLLLAVHSETLARSGLRFDPRFRFHFYDMDFCRRAEQLALSCGTWDLSVMHESGGNFASADWQAAYESYLLKWGE